MATAKKLGGAQCIEDLRSIWENAARDFTPWLQENINLLSQALRLNIQLVEREVPVDDFAVDLVVKSWGLAGTSS